jgi:hypothetical protein
METKTTFRARVFNYANQLNRVTTASWSICLTKAWQLYRLAKAMRAGAVTFYYYKADGTIRRAVGTLRNLPAGCTIGKQTKPSYKTLAYFDTEKQSFRCFKIENLIAVA